MSRRMKPGSDPQIHFQEQNSDRNPLRILGDPLSDTRYEGIIFQDLPAEYAGIIYHTYVDENFGLGELRASVTRYCVDHVARSSSIAGPGTALSVQAAGIRCFARNQPEHYRRDCPTKSKT